MPTGVYIRTEEVKRRMSESHKGKTSNVKGKHHSEKTKHILSIKGKGRIMSEETRKKLSENHKGKPTWNKDKRGIYSEDYRKKISEGNKGKILSEETRQKISLAHKGKKLSKETKERMSNVRVGKYIGDKAQHWKGGKDKLNRLIRNRFQYKQWVSSCMTRDNWTCQTCNNQSKLQVHHKKPLILILEENNITNVEQALLCEEIWNIDNGITLCLDCHNQTEAYLRTIKREGGKIK